MPAQTVSGEDENNAPELTAAAAHRPLENALQLGPRKKLCHSDPLIHHGRHFGRMVNALCNVFSLLTNGILRLVERCEEPDESFTADERREYRVFRSLILIVPGLEKRIMNCSQEELRLIMDLLQKGSSSARSDDTKSLKSAVIDWITPRGEPLIPPLPRNVKTCRGFNHEVTGALLCPANLDWSDPEVKAKLRDGEYIIPGDQWPIMIYKDYKYDSEDPWNGLLRSKLLISAYKHIFTSPSSVEKEPKATRSGNARIHGMTSVTIPSIAYIATQVRFALSSSAVFCRTDITTDSQRFYDSVIEFLEDPMEQEDVSDLLTFWNRWAGNTFFVFPSLIGPRIIFPGYSSAKQPITKDSALARLKEKRALRALNSVSSVSPR
ncbi:hypothetical protein Hypma_000416 [Hypsizygus marmoreus]|uniref:Uncharacterized protein n=1 Tax=Hypsizygus marmoreus TaxID=39966 RepID=A0A369JAG7_HYPMA|nr:hypothetical protein Hypma_000416 [Hypsizygus marmoreus]